MTMAIYPCRSRSEAMELAMKFIEDGVQFAYTPHDKTLSYVHEHTLKPTQAADEG